MSGPAPLLDEYRQSQGGSLLDEYRKSLEPSLGQRAADWVQGEAGAAKRTEQRV